MEKKEFGKKEKVLNYVCQTYPVRDQMLAEIETTQSLWHIVRYADYNQDVTFLQNVGKRGNVKFFYRANIPTGCVPNCRDANQYQ
jgi:hypothetical protein